jgi:uncharacterized protein
VRPLTVDVTSLPPEGQVYEVRLEAAELDEFLGASETSQVQAAGPLEAEIRVMPSGDDVFVVGSLRGRVRYHCRRCLEPFEDVLGAEFHLTFSRASEASADQALHREDLEVEPLVDPYLDLTKSLLEQVDLALNPYPICRAACRGLCDQCGADLNKVECGCSAPTRDPRFSVLEDWGRVRK